MLSVGFDEDVERILENSPKERQTLLFSATMPTWVKRLTRKYQRTPVTVDLVGDEEAGKMAETIRWGLNSEIREALEKPTAAVRLLLQF